ncbi:MAG: DNA-binding protein, partial [Defluviitaleaceae bacterium]|nr:DNA-binding protein [Defluviitaleaceae bacterium]
FELSYLKPEHQDYIAVSIEGNDATPSLSQVQRMRKLDKTNELKPDVIDGILMEEKKEADKVIISSTELAQYFGKTATPRDMKDKIMELLEKDFKLNQKALPAPEKKSTEKEK